MHNCREFSYQSRSLARIKSVPVLQKKMLFSLKMSAQATTLTQHVCKLKIFQVSANEGMGKRSKLVEFSAQKLFQIRACVISARKPNHLDVTTMFTYSYTSTFLGQSERAYYHNQLFYKAASKGFSKTVPSLTFSRMLKTICCFVTGFVTTHLQAPVSSLRTPTMQRSPLCEMNNLPFSPSTIFSYVVLLIPRICHINCALGKLFTVLVGNLTDE